MKKIFLGLIVFLGGLVACFNQGMSEGLVIEYPTCSQEDPNDSIKIGDEKIALSAIPGFDFMEYYENQKRLWEFKDMRLKDFIIQKALEDEVKSKDRAVLEKFINEKVVGKTIKITEKEIMKFAEERQVPPNRLSEPAIKERIEKILQEQKKSEAVEAFVVKKFAKSKTKLQANFCKPLQPRFEIPVGNSPVYGNDDAKVTIMEFSDFQCPYCANAAKGAVDEIKKAYGKKVKIVFKHFPLDFHQNAKKAAEASMCANEQGKFWQYHDTLFKNNEALKEDDLKKYATDLKLDAGKFNECLQSGKMGAAIAQDMAVASSGIKGTMVKSTPTFFINGLQVAGALPFSEFKKIIDQELNKKN